MNGVVIQGERSREQLLDERDRQLLNRLQSHLPLKSNPFQAVGEELGMTETEVLERLSRLKQKGIIRRIGASMNSQSLGYVSTLVALKVPEGRLMEVAGLINQFPGVTHNYQRNHTYNLWFTLISPSQQELEGTLKELQKRVGNLPLLNLPARRLFKIRAEFVF